MGKKNKKKSIKQRIHDLKSPEIENHRSSVETVEELHEFKQDLIRHSMNYQKNFINGPAVGRLWYIYNYLDYEYHRKEPTNREPLKAYLNDYIAVFGVIGGVRKFRDNYRLLLLEPVIYETLDGDPYEPTTKGAPLKEDIYIDNHIWIDLDKLDHHAAYPELDYLIPGENIGIGCRVFAYHGSVGDHKYGIKYGVRRCWIISNNRKHQMNEAEWVAYRKMAVARKQGNEYLPTGYVDKELDHVINLYRRVYEETSEEFLEEIFEEIDDLEKRRHIYAKQEAILNALDRLVSPYPKNVTEFYHAMTYWDQLVRLVYEDNGYVDYKQHGNIELLDIENIVSNGPLKKKITKLRYPIIKYSFKRIKLKNKGQK